MMTLTNDILTIEVSPQGAEMQSLKRDGKEYLWSGDAAYWNRQAPILFPVVGKPYENTIRMDGKECTMKQHGFARDSRFEAISSNTLRMLDADGHSNYPYDFDLKVQYSLMGTAVEIVWTVVNLGTREMHFQIGAHPGFMLPDYDVADSIHGFVRYFDGNGKQVSPIITSALEDGNRVPVATPISIPAEMPITADTFAHDALIFERGQVVEAVLCDKQGRAVLSVCCSQAEAFGIWAPYKEGCPFVCLEPWCGICDEKGFCGDIANRTYSHRLAPGENYRFTYTIKLL